MKKGKLRLAARQSGAVAVVSVNANKSLSCALHVFAYQLLFLEFSLSIRTTWFLNLNQLFKNHFKSIAMGRKRKVDENDDQYDPPSAHLSVRHIAEQEKRLIIILEGAQLDSIKVKCFVILLILD